MRDATIGQVAKTLGVSPKTIRLWEEKGLIRPPGRRANGYRIYSSNDVALLRVIKQGRDLGLTLRELREILDLHRRGVPPCEQVLSAIATHVAAIDAQLARLQARREMLARIHQVPWATLSGDACTGTVCHIIERAGEFATDCCHDAVNGVTDGCAESRGTARSHSSR
jgi:DNA-binding transcriptional MerR regulator